MKVKRFFLFFLSLVLSFSYLFTGSSALAVDDVLRESQIVNSDTSYYSFAIQNLESNKCLGGQTFTASSTYYATRIDVKVKRVGNPGTFKIGIKAIAGGYPTGNFLAYAYLNANSVPTVYTWISYSFETYFPPLTQSTQYALTIEAPSDSLSNNSNYLSVKGTVGNPYAGGAMIQDTTPATLWVTNTATQANGDLQFRIYGSASPTPKSVTTGQYTLYQVYPDSTANYSVSFWAQTSTLDSDNITMQLSDSITFSDLIPVVQWTGTSSNITGIYYFSAPVSSSDNPPLLPNSKYYYRAKAMWGGIAYYGSIMVIDTFPRLSPKFDKPSVDIIKIENVSEDYNMNYVYQITSRINTTNTTEDIATAGIAFSLSLSDTKALLPTIYSYQAKEILSNNTYVMLLHVGGLAVYSGQTIYLRAYIQTSSFDELYSPIIAYNPNTGYPGTTIPTPAISTYVKGLKAQFGLTGTFGSWAFMGILLLIIALIFGTATLSVKDNTMRTALGVIWMLISIAVVGAFIFTGELGIWPILILVGGVVCLIILIVSVKVSGSGGGV